MLASLKEADPAADVFRCVSPEETVARIQPLMGVMGITRVANVTGLDRVGIPVVMVCRPNARSVAVAQGKGISLAAARASGLMESVESYHAECVTGPLFLASLEELRYDWPIADIGGLPRRKGARFTPHMRLLWMAGRDLLNGDTATLVPHELVHLDLTQTSGIGTVFAASSNGLASGNSKLEAICHGICEVIERDATTLWHLASESVRLGTQVNLATIDDPVSLDLITKFKNAYTLVGVWETTSDIGVPAYLCRVAPRDKSSSHTVRPATGMGCHPSRVFALRRALTEAAQSRLTFISGARDDLFRDDYQRFLGPAAQEEWRMSIRAEPARDFRAAATWSGASLGDAVRWLLDRLKSVGIRQAVAVDLTRPEFNVSVVRMVVPGLEGIDDADYVPGHRAAAILASES